MHENISKLKDLLLDYGYFCRSGAPDECITQTEKMLDKRFSEEYKDCLRFTNGGEFINGGVTMYAVYNEDDECKTSLLLGFANNPRNRPSTMPDDYVIIGSDLLGDLICLTSKGLVILWCHETNRVFDTYNSIYEFFSEFVKCSDPAYAEEIYNDT